MVKNLPAQQMQEMQETQVPSLGGENPLEEEMAPHSSILAWKIPWIEETGRLQSMGLQSRTIIFNYYSGCISSHTDFSVPHIPNLPNHS